MTMVPALLRQLIRKIQIKKIITNPPSINNSKNGWLLVQPQVLQSQTNHVLSHLTEAKLQDDVIATFQFQGLVSY